MVNGFRIVPEAEALENWDGWLASFPDRGIRQSFVWGRHKTGGWTPLHAAWFANGRPAAMALVLTRRAPLGAATLAWVNAGPVFGGDLAALRGLLDGLTARLRLSPRAVLRLAPRVDADAALETTLREAGLVPARAALDSGRTVVVDLRPDLETLRASLDRKWRNQLKKAESAAPAFEFGSGTALLGRVLKLHDETRKRKGLKDGVTTTTLEKAARDFGPALTFAVGSVAGRDGCALSWWTFEGKATLWLSAVNEDGMKACLPNAAYWAAFERLRAEGVESFDLSGIDEKLNPGVTHFKLGTGGAVVACPGEWDWSATRLPRAAFNLLLGAVRGRLAR